MQVVVLVLVHLVVIAVELVVGNDELVRLGVVVVGRHVEDVLARHAADGDRDVAGRCCIAARDASAACRSRSTSRRSRRCRSRSRPPRRSRSHQSPCLPRHRARCRRSPCLPRHRARCRRCPYLPRHPCRAPYRRLRCHQLPRRSRAAAPAAPPVACPPVPTLPPVAGPEPPVPFPPVPLLPPVAGPAPPEPVVPPEAVSPPVPGLPPAASFAGSRAASGEGQ